MRILKALNRFVLQSDEYEAIAFAALSPLSIWPQPLDFNDTLIEQLSDRKQVERALEHLRPAVKAHELYSASDAYAALGMRTCAGSGLLKDLDELSSITWPLALYGMQRCYALVRAYELHRRTRFDFVLRLRPDHLFEHPLPSVLNLSVPLWPRGGAVLTVPGGTHDFALVDATAAATFFNAFDAATSCLFTTPSQISNGLPQRLQCWRPRFRPDVANCLIEALLAFHAVPIHVHSARNPLLVARLCKVNETSGEVEWPAWPMPTGTMCLSWHDALKRPRPEIHAGAGSNAQHPVGSTLHVLLVLAALGGLSAVIAANSRARTEVFAVATFVGDTLLPTLQARLEPVWELIGPVSPTYVAPLYRRLRDAVDHGVQVVRRSYERLVHREWTHPWRGVGWSPLARADSLDDDDF